MASYQYVAYNTNGEKIQGVIEAGTEKAAEELLWGMDAKGQEWVAEVRPEYPHVTT